MPVTLRGALSCCSLLASLAVAACGEPSVPAEPTWADVEPIMRAQCNHCHGATAKKTGAVGSLVYRFDFYDMAEAVCGEATLAIDNPKGMARNWSSLIAAAITPKANGHARMPPAPAEPLEAWQRKTLLRWTEQPFPARGSPSSSNRRPRIEVSAPRLANGRLPLTALVEDPDGEPVVGVLKVGPHILKMDRAGSFTTILETGLWPPGRYPLTAVLCDGWGTSTVSLGSVDVLHDESGLTTASLFGTPNSGPPVMTTPVVAPVASLPAAGGSGGAGAAPSAPMTAPVIPTPPAPVMPAPVMPTPRPTPPDAAAPDVRPRSTAECADLDGNGVLDCRETLAKNPDFKRDISEWTPDEGAGVAFDAQDAEGISGSGSIVVTNSQVAAVDGANLLGARQCLPTTGAERYDVAAQVRLQSGQDGAAAGIRVSFYSDAGCTGIVAGFFMSDAFNDRDQWRDVRGLADAPRGAKSMLVRLVVSKPFRQATARGYFDNVLIRARSQ